MSDFSEDAITLVTESWTKTYEAWGEKGVERINALIYRGAKLVAESPDCDRLESISLSGDLSFAPNDIVFYAEAKNGYRFYITEDDIKNGRKVVSQNAKSRWLDDQQFFEISLAAVKARIPFHCHFSEPTVQRAVVGRTVVEIILTHLDENGERVNKVAKCYFDALSLKEVEFVSL